MQLLLSFQSDDKSLWYRDGDIYKQIKNCSVKLRNILEFDDSETAV